MRVKGVDVRITLELYKSLNHNRRHVIQASCKVARIQALRKTGGATPRGHGWSYHIHDFGADVDHRRAGNAVVGCDVIAGRFWVVGVPYVRVIDEPLVR